MVAFVPMRRPDPSRHAGGGAGTNHACVPTNSPDRPWTVPRFATERLFGGSARPRGAPHRERRRPRDPRMRRPVPTNAPADNARSQAGRTRPNDIWVWELVGAAGARMPADPVPAPSGGRVRRCASVRGARALRSGRATPRLDHAAPAVAVVFAKMRLAAHTMAITSRTPARRVHPQRTTRCATWCMRPPSQ